MELLKTLRRVQPGMRDAIKTFALPGLLQLSGMDTLALLRSLNLEDSGHDNNEDTIDADADLCLLTIEVAESSRLLSGLPVPSQACDRDFSSMDTGIQSPHQSTLKTIVKFKVGMLAHKSSNIRIHALSLLVRSVSPKEPFPIEILQSLQRHLPWFHMEVDTKSRNEFIAIVKKLLSRVTTVIVAQGRKTAPDGQGAQMVERNILQLYSPGNSKASRLRVDVNLSCMEQHISFMKWYISFLHGELQPTASYQRHISALTVLHDMMIQRRDPSFTSSLAGTFYEDYLSGPGPFYCLQRLRTLLDLVMDPFSDVRETATALLIEVLTTHRFGPNFARLNIFAADFAMPTQHIGESHDPFALSNLLRRVEVVARATGRADHADGAARFYLLVWELASDAAEYSNIKAIVLDRLIDDLRTQIRVAKANLHAAVADSPIHGTLIALRYDCVAK